MEHRPTWIHGGLLGYRTHVLRRYVHPAWWLERWRLTLENPYTVSVDPMLITGGIPAITPEPDALSCVTSQCARSYELLVRSCCSDGGLSATTELDLNSVPGPCRELAKGQGIRGAVTSRSSGACGPEAIGSWCGITQNDLLLHYTTMQI